tara:strand:- start:1370 stop:3235 length:1866 start_codon:yes stop_codon:yes gene_type:complete
MPNQTYAYDGTFAAGNCTPRSIVVDDTTCSLTRASIKAFTKNDFEAQGFREVGMDRIIAQTAEARMAGAAERTLTDLLLSRHVALNEGRSSGSQSVIAPYTLVPRRNAINVNYFTITAGRNTYNSGTAATLESGHNAGSTSGNPGGAYFPSSTFRIKVSAGSDPELISGESSTTINFNKSQIKDFHKYFHAGQYLLVETQADNMATISGKGSGGTTKTSVALQLKVLHVVADTATTAILTVAPSDYAAISATDETNRGWGSQSNQNAYQVEKGMGMILSNSTSDYEKFCEQGPATNDLSLIEYWAQTTRVTHKYNEEYIKALQAPLTSEYYKKFRQLPLAQQRRIQEKQAEQAFYNTVFYGQQISNQQTVEDYTKLPVVSDPVNADGCSSTPTLEYKANTLGIRTQLNSCGNIYDQAGSALNLDVLFETCYALKRERENDGAQVDTIDLMTDRFTASRIRDLMIKYYKSKYSADINMFIQGRQKLVDSVTNKVMYEYNVYDLPDQGVSMAVFTDPYFDDVIGAAPALGPSGSTNKHRARRLWLVDWSDIAINVIKTASAKRQTNVADDAYNCIIQPNVTHYQLNSKTFEVRVGNTNRHAILENFSDASPSVSVTGADVTIN